METVKRAALAATTGFLAWSLALGTGLKLAWNLWKYNIERFPTISYWIGMWVVVGVVLATVAVIIAGSNGETEQRSAAGA